MSERAALTKTSENKGKVSVSAKPKENFYESMDSPVEQIFHLQQTIGNQAVQRLIKSGTIQAKLKIGKPNDKYEQEADRLSDKVMSMPEPKGSLVTGHWSLGKRGKESSLVNSHSSSVQRQIGPEEEEKEPIQAKPQADQITTLVKRQVEPEEEEEVQAKLQRQAREEEEEPVQTKLVQQQGIEEEEEPVQGKLIQRQINLEEEEEEPVQAKRAINHTPAVTSNIEASVNSLKGGGQPLSESTRSYFEPRFGADFSQVRVHTDSKAAETAKSINAKAFTKGKDVVFGTGQYSPGTSSGKRLLAHELTHTIQQNSSRIIMPSYAESIKKGLKKAKEVAEKELFKLTANGKILSAAKKRAKGKIGKSYNYKPNWWYSPNKDLDGWRNSPKKFEQDQGAEVIKGEGIVNWGDITTCNVFVYDVLYVAGLNPPIRKENDHYYNAEQTYNRRGPLKDYFELIKNPKKVLPGDIMANGEHLEIVTSKIVYKKVFSAIGAHHYGAGEEVKRYNNELRFLRVKGN